MKADYYPSIVGTPTIPTIISISREGEGTLGVGEGGVGGGGVEGGGGMSLGSNMCMSHFIVNVQCHRFILRTTFRASFP